MLTSEEQLQAFFIEQYEKLNATDEQRSWDTEYRALLNQYMGTAAMKEALKLPLRSKTRRRLNNGNDGVLVFARKGNDYVFKFNDGTAPTDIAPQDAFKLLESTPDEKGYEVSERFEALYDETKKALFAGVTENDTEKSKRDALDKIRMIIQSNTVDHEYLEDLKTAVEYDAISGFALRQINKLKPAAYTTMPDIVSREYIHRVLYTYDNVLLGTETLILAEEIE